MLKKAEFPILEFDSAPTALIEPSQVIARADIPERCVFCFFQDVIDELVEGGQLVELPEIRLGSEIGRNPVYKLRDRDVIVMHPGVGAPLAVAFLEEIIAYGCNRIIACGGAGVLNSEHVLGHIVVPTSAVRDEGTSYHYLPPSREIEANPSAVAAIEAALKHHAVPYILGKTWTTDGIYRETVEKIALRRAEGCLTVEMETAAFMAAAQFRAAIFGQLLYSGDDLGGVQWDSRDWQAATTVRGKLFTLAVESVVAL